MNTVERIQYLKQKIKQAKDSYYNTVPEMSDAAFDLLEDQLRKIDPTNPILTQVGSKATGRITVKHRMPMGSLNKITTEEQLKKEFKDVLIFVQEKLDGLSIALYYENGNLIQAVTRGNGSEGELITYNVSRMKNVKTKLPTNFTGSLRGEIIFRKQDFEKLEEKYANPRNAASGICKRKDAKDCNKLTVIYFDVIQEGKTLNEDQKFVLVRNQLKLEYVNTECLSGLIVAQKYFEEYRDKTRKLLDHEIDGLVLKQGTKQLAYKFPSQSKISTVKNIKWTTGSTGRINPVVEIEPIEVGGITIRNVTGNNIAFLQELNVSIGAEVIISRRNDVIPAIEEVLVPGNGDLGTYIECPECRRTDIFRVGRYLKCMNKKCPAQNDSMLYSWVIFMGWELLGQETIEKLKDKISEPVDFYSLTQENFDIVGVSANGKKILDQIHQKKEVDLAEFIAAFAMPNVSTSRINSLVEAGFDTVEKILNINYENLLKIKGIQDSIANSIIDGIERRKNSIINVLPYISLKKAKSSGAYLGHGIKLTGTMKNSRKNLEKLAKENGAIIGWRKELKNVLITNDTESGSSKNKEATKNGYRIITEEEFFQSINFYNKQA